MLISKRQHHYFKNRYFTCTCTYTCIHGIFCSELTGKKYQIVKLKKKMLINIIHQKGPILLVRRQRTCIVTEYIVNNHSKVTIYTCKLVLELFCDILLFKLFKNSSFKPDDWPIPYIHVINCGYSNQSTLINHQIISTHF